MSKTGWIIFVVLLTLVIAGIAFAFTRPQKTPPMPTPTPIPLSGVTGTLSVPTPTPASGPPPIQIDAAKSYSAILNTTAGTITIALNAKDTPVAVNNFIALSRSGFYTNTIFHRVVKGFMIQGGDPRGDGSGGPGYKFADEPITRDYLRGTVAMANSGPNTNGSQFFIMHADYALPKNYVIFGQVIAGLDVVDKIAVSPVAANRFGEVSQPTTPVSINSIEVLEK